MEHHPHPDPDTALPVAPGRIPWLLVALLALWLFLVATRIAGPSDIYDKEQPRTIAYTADILGNHFWVLPHDTFGIPATKPPLYNWISLPFVAVFGYHEWTLKIPSVLASLAVVWIVYRAAKRLASRGARPIDSSGQPQPGEIAGCPDRLAAMAAFPALAAVLYLANPMTAKLLYLARPDMVLVACLLGAWLAATILVQSPQPSRRVQLAYWLCTIGAAFAKGPMVLLALAYLPLAAIVLTGGLAILKRSGWWWGIFLMLLTLAIFAGLAYHQEPEFFREVFLGREITGRMAGAHWYATLLNGPFYMVARFLPWSLLVMVMLWLIPLRRWFRHPLTPAILWMFLILVIYSFARTKRPDRYAPVYPAMVLIAAWCLMDVGRRFRVRPVHIVAASVVIVAGLAVYNQFLSEPAKTGFGDHAIAFARDVQKSTGNDPILFTDGELTPLETLLGANQLPDLPPESLSQIRWLIAFYAPGSRPVLVSEPLQQVDGPDPGRLALYRLQNDEAPTRYQEARVAPKIYADNATSDDDLPQTAGATRWLQFWRPHTSLSTGKQ